MSQENVEIVRRLYRAMDARDLEAARLLTHPDAVWVPDRRVGVGPVRGREKVIGFFADRAEMFVELQTDLERVWADDDWVLAFIRQAGQGRTSAVPFEIRIAHLWTLRDGVVVQGKAYANRGKALEATGLSE